MHRVALLVAFCAALGCQAGAAQSSRDGAAMAVPQIECAPAGDVCRAAVPVYIGWRVFQAQCAACHAADARGSSYAPDLTQRLRGFEQRDFFAALDRGYFGPQSSMPPRGRDPNVAPYYEELWAFLTARRDGALPAAVVEPLALEGGAP